MHTHAERDNKGVNDFSQLNIQAVAKRKPEKNSALNGTTQDKNINKSKEDVS